MRIASLISSGTEILCALGLGPSIVATSHECDFPVAMRTKPRVTRSVIASEASSAGIDRQVRDLLNQGRPLYELDIPLLAKLKPDLIVTQSQCEVCAIHYSDVVKAVQVVPSLRGTRVVALNPQSLTDVFTDIRRIAEAADCPAIAEPYLALLSLRVDAIEHRTRTLAALQRPRVVCIEWTDPLMLAGNWMPQLIDCAGGQQSFVSAGQHSKYVSWDAVRQFDPQVIVIAPCGFDLNRSRLEARTLENLEGWDSLDAVSNARAYVVDGNAYFNRSGPRLVETLELLAHLIQPERFASPALPTDAWSPVLRSNKRSHP